MRRRKNPNQAVLDIVAFVTSSALNIAIFVFSLILVYTLTMSAFNYGRNNISDSVTEKEFREVTVEIPENSTPKDIALILKDNKLISNENIFLLQATLNGTSNLFKTGAFEFDTHMKSGELMEILQTAPFLGNSADIKVTIIEGLTIKQMGELFESKALFPADDFVKSSNESEFDFPFLAGAPIRDNRLEGYLFPDTYFFAENSTPDDVIRKMLSRFSEVYNPDMVARAAEVGYTVDEIITIASIIEEEVSITSERAILSSIIYNRMEQAILLDMDSTIIYVVDKRKDRLLPKDFDVKSPYNTYINSGLPIGPISNPGLVSINAALNPDVTDYLYFGLKPDSLSEHFFVADYESYLEEVGDIVE